MTSEKNNAHKINILHFIYYFVTKCNLIVNQLLKNAFMDQAEVLKIGEISLGTSKDISLFLLRCNELHYPPRTTVCKEKHVWIKLMNIAQQS